MSVITFWLDYYIVCLEPLLLSALIPETLFVDFNFFIIPHYTVLFHVVNPNPPVVQSLVPVVIMNAVPASCLKSMSSPLW